MTSVPTSQRRNDDIQGNTGRDRILGGNGSTRSTAARIRM
jgi:hypothetical protein